MTSAFPKPFDDLVSEARRFAGELGTWPSQNKLKARLHVRAERARAVLEVLKASGFDPAEPDTDVPVPRRLHLVPAESSQDDSKSTPDTSADYPDIAGTLPVTGADLPPETVPVDHPGTPSDQDSSTGEPVTASAPSWPWLRHMRDRWRATRESSTEEPVTLSRPVHGWPLVLLAAPAFVAIWSGWVGLGALTGFGAVHPLPGIADSFTINSAITLPIGVETYAAYALRVWLAGHGSTRARRFAKRSSIGSLVLGAAGQVAYHLMTAAHLSAAPWPITTAVACLPVVVLGFGAALAHLRHTTDPSEVRR